MKMRGFFYTAFILLLCFGICKAVTLLCRVDEFSISIDPIIHDTLQRCLHNSINDLKSSCPMHSIMTNLCEQFPCIKSITCSYSTPHHAVLDIIARIPCYAVNTDYIITDDDYWLSRSLYNAYATERLVQITMPRNCVSDQFLQKKVITTLHQIPTTIFKYYAVCIHDEMNFCLHDKQDPSFSIVFNDLNVPTLNCLHQCGLIKDWLKDKGELTKKQTQWNADVRFEKQIIVSMEKGGYHDGSRIF